MNTKKIHMKTEGLHTSLDFKMSVALHFPQYMYIQTHPKIYILDKKKYFFLLLPMEFKNVLPLPDTFWRPPILN